MRRMVFTVVIVMAAMLGCNHFGSLSLDDYLDRGSNRYVLLKKDARLLDGPYHLVERVSSERMIVEKDMVTYTILLRGCKGFGGFYENLVKGSYLMDRGLYLLKDCSVSSMSNVIKAVIYRPANRVYIGMPDGFDNLSYTMPQLLHIAYGELYVDHSDTNYPLYQVFAGAEKLAKRNKKGYWETHNEPPAQSITNGTPTQQ